MSNQSGSQDDRKRKPRWYFVMAGINHAVWLSIIGSVLTDIVHAATKPWEVFAGSVAVGSGITLGYELRAKIDKLKKRSGVSMEENGRLILAELRAVRRLLKAILKSRKGVAS